MNHIQSSEKTRSGTRVVQVIIGFIMLSFFSIIPGKTLPADITGTSRTYMQSRETAAGDNLLPLYEYLDFSVKDLGKANISVHFGGWLGYDLRDDSFGTNKDKGSDLQYGYVMNPAVLVPTPAIGLALGGISSTYTPGDE